MTALLADLEMLEPATCICEALLQEDDTVVAPWYLLGWTNYLREDRDYWGNVRHYLGKAKQAHTQQPTDDEEMVKHIDELLAEVGVEEESEEVAADLELGEEDTEKAEQIANIFDSEQRDEEQEEVMES